MEVNTMGSTCCGPSAGSCSPNRNFHTKEEKVEMLKEYKESLTQETKAVEERIKSLSE